MHPMCACCVQHLINMLPTTFCRASSTTICSATALSLMQLATVAHPLTGSATAAACPTLLGCCLADCFWRHAQHTQAACLQHQSHWTRTTGSRDDLLNVTRTEKCRYTASAGSNTRRATKQHNRVHLTGKVPAQSCAAKLSHRQTGRGCAALVCLHDVFV